MKTIETEGKGARGGFFCSYLDRCPRRENRVSVFNTSRNDVEVTDLGLESGLDWAATRGFGDV